MEAVLTKTLADGSSMEATFLPERGMNLVSLKRNGVEVIDQSTRDLFDERSAGLGAIIGPHFHRRLTGLLPKIEDEGRYPHIARVKASGVDDPFSHGIGRYASWDSVVAPASIEAQLSGDTEWNGSLLKDLQGQNFKMWYNAEITKEGLELKLSVSSDYDSLVGLHYYYRLPNGKGTVKSYVRSRYLDQGEAKQVPSDWGYDSSGQLTFDLQREADYTFHPRLEPCSGVVTLSTDEYTLETEYASRSQEVSWQLYHPDGGSFVCIEPLSASNPRKPVLSVSSVNVKIRISDPAQ